MQATVMQAVHETLGRSVGLEEPLMNAGLDFLGASSSPMQHIFLPPFVRALFVRIAYFTCPPPPRVYRH